MLSVDIQLRLIQIVHFSFNSLYQYPILSTSFNTRSVQEDFRNSFLITKFFDHQEYLGNEICNKLNWLMRRMHIHPNFRLEYFQRMQRAQRDNLAQQSAM